MRISDWSSDVFSSDLGADQIPTRNAKAHNAAPLSERNLVPRMGDRQQQPARSRRVPQDDQNRSFGPTGPPCATAHSYGGRRHTGKQDRKHTVSRKRMAVTQNPGGPRHIKNNNNKPH